MENLIQAHHSALRDIETARAFAKEVHGENSEILKYLSRHEKVLEQTTADLLSIINSLHEGMRSNYNFPKCLMRDTMLYRGLITDDGKYYSLFKDFNEYRQEYADRNGKERAHRMIFINGSNEKAQVKFCDRKFPPNRAQYATLRELMIEAKGELTFHFVYDANNPN